MLPPPAPKGQTGRAMPALRRITCDRIVCPYPRCVTDPLTERSPRRSVGGITVWRIADDLRRLLVQVPMSIIAIGAAWCWVTRTGVRRAIGITVFAVAVVAFLSVAVVEVRGDRAARSLIAAAAAGHPKRFEGYASWVADVRGRRPGPGGGGSRRRVRHARRFARLHDAAAGASDPSAQARDRRIAGPGDGSGLARPCSASAAWRRSAVRPVEVRNT